MGKLRQEGFERRRGPFSEGNIIGPGVDRCFLWIGIGPQSPREKRRSYRDISKIGRPVGERYNVREHSPDNVTAPDQRADQPVEIWRLGSGKRDLEARAMNHRQRLETVLVGDQPDRVPVALWRHFPVDDQDPRDLAEAHIEYQMAYDFDLVKVTPASSFCTKDWGVQDEWRGASEGTRDYTVRAINHPEDWARLPVLDPEKGYLGRQLACLRQITSTLGPDVPVIQTIFSPLAQAKNLVGGGNLLAHIRQYPDLVKRGLMTIAESTRAFIRTASQTGIAGIFYAVQHAQYHLLTPLEYQSFGSAYDLLVLEPAQELWLNMLHLHGENIMFDLFVDYPVSILNW